jgi:NAD(P)-dependent dehydrogenase (short-subunit alcohol dehydrogenase family)
MLAINLQGKVAMVTGATQGIGLGIATMMAKAGCLIAGCGLDPEDSAEAIRFVQQVQGNGSRAFYQQRDLKSEKEIHAFVTAVIQHFGKIDLLISNAGANRFTAPESCSPAFWQENIDLNLRSHWLISQACYTQLKENQGVILLMASNHAYATLPNCFPYNVTKAGITGLVKALAVQWGPDIRVLGLAPGFIQTEGGAAWFESFPDPEVKRSEVIRIHPVGKLGTVEEVGAFTAYLCSEYAGFLSGTTYLMDGGRSAVMQDI